MYLERLEQYPNLSKGTKIINPEKLDFKDLSTWWYKAREICGLNKFAALAFNQISETDLNSIGFFANKPAMIYIHEINTATRVFDGFLLINPQILLERKRSLVSFEACGSIVDDKGKLPLMAILRPDFMVMSAFIWSPGQKPPDNNKFVLKGDIAAIVDHEMHHLRQLTALSFPDLMLDLRKKPILRDILRHYNYIDQLDIVRRIMESGFIVYDESGKIIQVKPDGELLNEFGDLNDKDINIPFPSQSKNIKII